MATYGYIRTSKYRPSKKLTNGDAGLSPEIQTTAIEDYCKKNGLKLAAIFEDDNESAKQGDIRPAWDDMWEKLCEGDTVIAFKMTRVGRGTVETLERLDALDKRGVDVVTLDGKYDTRSSIGKVITGILCLFAEYENAQRAEWIRASHEKIAERGSWPGGHLPFGYRYSNDHFVEVDSDAALIVQYIFERKAAKVPRTTIAAELNEKGEGTPRGNGAWGHTTIGTILRNRAYIGERELRGAVFKADIPAIIERSVWEKCNLG